MKFIRIEKELGEEEIKDIKEITFNVFNHKKEYLGWIDYKYSWKKHKQFIFSPAEDTFFTIECLKEITDYLDKLNKESQEKPKYQKKIIKSKVTQEAYDEIKAICNKYNLGEPSLKVGDEFEVLIK